VLNASFGIRPALGYSSAPNPRGNSQCASHGFLW
jgi:hypothetical protein